MKTKYYFLNILMALMACTAFTSCDVWYDDNDYDQSKALSGQWTGDFGMNYTYTFTYRGRRYTEIFDSYDTDVVFYPDHNGATYGYGKQVDFYEYGPYEYIYHKFDWRIVNGIVQLRYYEFPDMDTDIYDYHMTNDYFTGYFDNSNEGFKLRKIADYYNWTPYVNTYGYGGRTDWYGGWYNNYYGGGYYYAKTRSGEANDSIAAPMPEEVTDGQIVSFGNRKKITAED